MVLEILRKMGYKTIDNKFYLKIDEWGQWHKGKVEAFHSYNQYNGKKLIKRERLSLSMAKKICEDWANLLLNEKAESTTNNEKYDKILREIFLENNFRVKSNQLVEISFALGTGAFVENIIGGKVNIDYIKADMIYPLSWDNGKIYECAFASEKVFDKKECIYIQLHLLEDGKYTIENHMFEKRSGRETELPNDMLPKFKTNSKNPLFQIVKPNIINSFDFSNPMGLSVYANAIDVLKGIDLVYDSFCNEFRLGKKRIIVPVGMAQLVGSTNGVVPVFDDNDTEFYAMKENDDFTTPKEINMEIRASDHDMALTRNLDILSALCGLGNDRYDFNNQTVKTATEVISEKSELYQNLKKHEIILRDALTSLIRAVLFLSGISSEDLEIKIDFDDSIIHDTASELLQNIQLVNAGLMKPWEFRMWKYNEDEETAKKMTEEEPIEVEE